MIIGFKVRKEEKVPLTLLQIPSTRKEGMKFPSTRRMK